MPGEDLMRRMSRTIEDLRERGLIGAADTMRAAYDRIRELEQDHD